MGEYLCNPLNEELLDVEISVGGSSSDIDLGVSASIEKPPKPTFVVGAGEAVRFVRSTVDEYDEMVCHWGLRYRTALDGGVSASFATFKRLEDTQAFADVPILGGPAKVVSRT